MEFDCHINVEICSTVQAVKYIYKYLYKGHDRVCFRLAQHDGDFADEVQTFQSGRWVSAPEAAWRIFAFDLYDMYPAVIPLQVHLPDMHMVTFAPDEVLEDVAGDEKRQTTMLTAYFECNATVPDNARLLYHEFPQYYTWNTSLKAWTKRIYKTSTIGRLTYASPTEGERYYLRLLLCNVRDTTSYDHLRTIDGVLCATFKEACDMRGLLARDDYAYACMTEASAVHMPSALRRLFAVLLNFADGIDATDMWTKFYSHLSDDLAYAYPGDTYKVACLTYTEVGKYIATMGKYIGDYNIPNPFHDDAVDVNMTRDISDALTASVPNAYFDLVDKLNNLQRVAYASIMDVVLQDIPGAFFIDGPGGTDKTFLYCTLYAELRKRGKFFLPTTTSGIATSNLPTGRTAHSRFKIPIDVDGSYTCSVSKQSSLAQLLRATSLIIWDEASMAKKEDIEALDVLLQDMCDTKSLFGGKVVVFGGDFRQVLHVLPNKSQNEAISASLVSSYIWPSLHKFALTDNDCVDSINEHMIGSISGDSYTYIGIDTLVDDNCGLCTPEFLNTLCPSCMSLHTLVLKVNSPVILIRNLDPANELCNGTRLVCKAFHKHVIVCEIASGHCKGDQVFIPRITLSPSSSMKFPFKFQRIQFPIKLCFVMTINKAQGQTLARVGVYLLRSCFSHGQLYVAFSRARRRTELTVFVQQPESRLEAPMSVTNVVSFDILYKSGILPV